MNAAYEDAERPASPHAEMTILGAMMVDEQTVIDATELLDAEDFALDSHRRIYRAMLALVALKESVDLTTVMAFLGGRQELDGMTILFLTAYGSVGAIVRQNLARLARYLLRILHFAVCQKDAAPL